jgi:hypothetical protein
MRRSRDTMPTMSAAVDAIVPLASVLLGAGITYALNVRTRRRDKADDVIHDAIAALAVAVTSHDYISGVGPWQGATDDEHRAFLTELSREANHDYVRAVAAARAAIARASAYEPELRRFASVPPTELVEHGDEITGVLRRALGE